MNFTLMNHNANYKQNFIQNLNSLFRCKGSSEGILIQFESI